MRSAAARRAREQGATRFCMGAAWRDAAEGEQFDRVLDMVRGVRALGMEACCTLGMLTQAQADALADAGLSAYNHNLDTSPEFYGHIITTRTYTDRLDTIARVRRAGITVCCGGIIGMGEQRPARWGLLQQLASLDPHPESVPVNLLARVEGTPLGDRPAGGSAGAGPHHRDRPHPDAARVRAPERGPRVALAGSAGPLFSGRRQLRVPRRAAADDARIRRPTSTAGCSRTSGCSCRRRPVDRCP